MQHTKACLAKAMLCAVENFRDSESVTLTEFVEFAQRDVLTTAESYLDGVLLDCSCKLSDTDGHPEAHGQTVPAWRADRDSAVRADYTWAQ